MTLKEEALGSFELDKSQVDRAVGALRQYVEKRAAKDDTALFDDAQQINLQLNFKKIPSVKNKIIKVHLPHALVKANSDVCLFVKDLNTKERDYTPTVNHFKELLTEKGIKHIPNIIPLKSVKLEYQPFEAKKNLSNMYDCFLTDDRIARLLPALLGKHFYGRKKFPMQVNLKAKDLKKEMSKVLATSQCIIGGRGSTCQMAVGHTAMKESNIQQNIMEAVEKLAGSIPGGANNIRNLHIKTEDSPALPIYISTGSCNDVVLPVRQKKKQEMDEGDEVVGIDSGKVRITKYGRIVIVGAGKRKRKLEQVTGVGEEELVEGEEESDEEEEEEKEDEEKEEEEKDIKKKAKADRSDNQPKAKKAKKVQAKKSEKKDKNKKVLSEKKMSKEKNDSKPQNAGVGTKKDKDKKVLSEKKMSKDKNDRKPKNSGVGTKKVTLKKKTKAKVTKPKQSFAKKDSKSRKVKAKKPKNL